MNHRSERAGQSSLFPLVRECPLGDIIRTAIDKPQRTRALAGHRLLLSDCNVFCSEQQYLPDVNPCPQRPKIMLSSLKMKFWKQHEVLPVANYWLDS